MKTIRAVKRINTERVHSPVDEGDLPEEARDDGPVAHPGAIGGRGEEEAEADAQRAHHQQEAAPVLPPKPHP